MEWKEIALEIAPESLEEAIGFFNRHGILALNIDDPRDLLEHQSQVRWDYIDETLLNRDLTKAFVKAYVEKEEEAASLALEAREEGFLVTVTGLLAEDWENGWKKYYKPFLIGEKMVIIPAWEEVALEEGQLPIYLDSGMAFGTGTHETTKMCVAQLEKLPLKDLTVLDIGTGSGILSICAGRLGAKSVTSVDIDELAVKIAKENVALNGLDAIITVKQGDLFQEVSGQFDLIIANIVADIIKELLPQIKQFLKPGGLFLASGIISEREEEVIKTAMENGFQIRNQLSENGWSALVAADQTL